MHTHRHEQISSDGWYSQAMEYLLGVVQELSLARDLGRVMEIVRHAGRELTRADGATFVLRDGDRCFYADEEAISPLWKGQRFPMRICISGWVMQHAQPVVIEDIYADARIPADAYRPTFVKSMAMVPIRTASPIGAIGNYWASHHRASPQELKALQALADSTSIAMENVQLYAELEQRVRERTAQLEASYKQLESFSYSVSHDLRTPLQVISGFAELLQKTQAERLDAAGRKQVDHIVRAGERMQQLIDDLIALSRTTLAPLQRQRVNLSAIASEIAETRRATAPERKVQFVIADGLYADGDPGLLRVALENLIGNAWKYTGKRAEARIEFDAAQTNGEVVYRVRDNGAGFDMKQADRLFGTFQRLHRDSEFPGTGIGLATVQRVIEKHGGRIWAEAAVDQGATFCFTLG